jgi:hypothetical protein
VVLAIYDHAEVIFDGHRNSVFDGTAELLHREKRGRVYKFTSRAEITGLPFAIPPVFVVKVVYEAETRLNESDIYARLMPLHGQSVPIFYSSATFSVPPAAQSKVNLGPAAGPLPALPSSRKVFLINFGSANMKVSRGKGRGADDADARGFCEEFRGYVDFVKSKSSSKTSTVSS